MVFFPQICPFSHTPSPIVVQLISHVQLFAAPWTAAYQASLSVTISQSSLKLMSIESVMPSDHLILCRPLLLLPSIFPSIRVFSNELALWIRWPKYWSFSFSISPSNEYSGLIFFRIAGLISLQSKGLSRVFSSTTVQIPVDGIIIYPIAHFSNLGYMFNIASSLPFSYQIHHWVLMVLSHWSSVPTTLTHSITISWLDYCINLSTGVHASPLVSFQSSLYCSRLSRSLFCLNDFL